LSERISSWYQKAKDSAIGSSFDKHVVGGYRFLMRFYHPNDEIYIFGFSRGAYTARFLAEMLDHVGLLSHGNEEMIFFAWKTFSQWQCRSADSTPEAKAKRHEMFLFMKGFRETFSRPVRRIQFLGLFDTVNSVPRFETAWMQRSKFPYTAKSSARVIRHAVSIDERRAKFRQDLMYQQKPRHAGEGHHWHWRKRVGIAEESRSDEKQPDQDRGRQSRPGGLAVPYDDEMDGRYRCRSKSRSDAKKRVHSSDGCSVKSHITFSEAGYDAEEDQEQNIDEVWFAGCHADIGGGWDEDPGQRAISHIPLMWMVREAAKAGLAFDLEKVAAAGCAEAIQGIGKQVPVSVPDIQINSTGPSRSETMESERKTGVMDHLEMIGRAHLSRIHDSLDFRCGLNKVSVMSWRIMEYLPFRRMDLQPDGSWKPIRWPLPCGEVRDVPENARVHGSVIWRMREDESYRPGNLIVGGGGRGRRVAPKEHGIGEWVCVSGDEGPIGEIWVKKS
jgi:uncharacterized protein (DUF2235 family)